MHPAYFPIDFIVILLFLAIAVPWRGAIRIKRLLEKQELDSRERISLYVSTIGYQWLLFAVILWRSLARGLSFEQLGLKIFDPGKTILTALGLTALLCANQWAGLTAMSRLPAEKRGFLWRFTQIIMPRSPAETSLFSLLACTAGLSEEFLYRGFVFAALLQGLANFPFSVYAAAGLSSVLFGIAHAYQGRRGIITTTIVGIIFCGVRIFTGNLAAPALAHIGIDLFAGLYARRVLAS